MTAKETSTWSKVVNQEEALLQHTEKCLKIEDDKNEKVNEGGSSTSSQWRLQEFFSGYSSTSINYTI